MLRQAALALFAAVALGCSAGNAIGGSETASKASLQLIRQTPMAIKGNGFRPTESVRVSAAGRQWRVRASSRGAFVLTLTGVDRCGGARVLAVGSGGSRAVLKALPSPLCAPAKSP